MHSFSLYICCTESLKFGVCHLQRSGMKKKENIQAVHNKEHAHDDHDHDHGSAADNSGGIWRTHWALLLALVLLFLELGLQFGTNTHLPLVARLAINIVAYLLAGHNVLRLAFRKMLRFDFFNEFFLMSVATLGAFAIGAYSEGVAVMVFYSIGEWVQDTAVSRAKGSIKALLDIRPDTVTVIRNGKPQSVSPSTVEIGETIQVRHGEKVALDGELISDAAVLNSAALTGESAPDNKEKGDPIYAGMINLDTLIDIKTTSEFTDSKLSRILSLVQDATARKSQTQLFISRFAAVYTPIVFALAMLVVGLPYFFVADYDFQNWLYRGLVFLVISCPCALVVSIPLGYFGGIGLASSHGILFKGANYLDVMAKIDTVVMDKTGTLTKGVFKVQKVVASEIDENELLKFASAIESKSTHPVAKAIVEYAGEMSSAWTATDVKEIPGRGMMGSVDGKTVIAGNTRLLKEQHIAYEQAIDREVNTTISIAVDGKYAGYIVIADELKPDAAKTIKGLHALGIQTVLLSGDKESVALEVAKELGIDSVFGGLLPEGKVKEVTELKEKDRRIAFVGDGVNDAPVIALADAGIAMGGLGSDAAIETADIVIQNDQPYKILSAIKIGKITRNIVWQNIAMAMGVKLVVLILGAGGIATLWEAVIADVGVALLAILNAVRVQRKKV